MITVMKIHYDRMTDAEIEAINEKLEHPGSILQSDMGVSEKLAIRVFLAAAANGLGSAHLICLPKDGDKKKSHIRPFSAGFPPDPESYTYQTALKFDKPFRVERMSPEERDAIIEIRGQNRSEGKE